MAREKTKTSGASTDSLYQVVCASPRMVFVTGSPLPPPPELTAIKKRIQNPLSPRERVGERGKHHLIWEFMKDKPKEDRSMQKQILLAEEA